MAARKDAAVWAQIRLEYETSQDSVRAIADRHEVSEAAIRKRAKADKWKRLEDQRALSIPLPAPATPPAPPTDEAGELMRRGRALVGRLMGEVDFATSHQGELEQLIELETNDDRSPKRREAMYRAISTPGRAMTIKALASALSSFSEQAAGPKGKKEQLADAAKAAGSRFATMAPPGARTN